MTFDPFDDRNPQFSADAKTLYFVRTEGDFGGPDRPTSQLFCVPLETDRQGPRGRRPTPRATTRRGGRGATGSTTPPKEPKIDWPGLKRRTRQVTRGDSSVFSYVPANDGKTLIFVASEGGGGRRGDGGGGGAAIYTIQDNGKRMNRLASSAPGPAEAEGDTPRGRSGGGGGGISGLNLTRDGRTLYFQEGDSVYSVPVSAVAEAAEAAAAGVATSRRPATPAGPAAAAEGTRRR